ncbi:PAAR-like domain-containing protein [Rhizobium beringeri]
MSLPSPQDIYAGEPQYPSPWTTRKPREGLRDNDPARVICLAPDVCKTPIGSSIVPIPYQVVDYCGHDALYTDSVRFTSQKVMVLRAHTTHVHGDKPGTARGIKIRNRRGHMRADRPCGSRSRRRFARHSSSRSFQDEQRKYRRRGDFHS